jgi:hypothetical protein
MENAHIRPHCVQNVDYILSRNCHSLLAFWKEASNSQQHPCWFLEHISQDLGGSTFWSFWRRPAGTVRPTDVISAVAARQIC